MAEASLIRWTHATFNPWRGCQKVSQGCQFCYAEVQAKRNPKVLGTWGPSGTRAIAADSYWKEPERWNAKADAAGTRWRVFCASLADVFEDRPLLVAPRERLWRLITATPNLDWLLLSKRPENMVAMLPPAWLKEPQPNVWLGATVESAEYCDQRIPPLVALPAAVRFLSLEPLLGPIPDLPLEGVDWVIVGGESGTAPRPMQPEWARQVRDRCREHGTTFFYKQAGGSGRDKGGHLLDGVACEEYPVPRG